MNRQEPSRRAFGRAALAGLAAALLVRPAHAATRLRLGLVQYGSAQWLVETIRRHGLDAQHGLTLAPAMLADTGAGRIALLAGSADVVVADWPFVAARRAAGMRLCFAPFSASLGGVMVPAVSPVANLADLKGARLGVAGGKLDKSWLLVQAAGRAAGIDLPAAARLAYGAPPLLGAKLIQGELDAVLTFWPFAARLEAAGYREAIAVADCARALGLPPALPWVGFVFHEDWARAHRAAIDGFLAAAAAADRLLAGADAAAEWAALRPLMAAPDDSLFRALQRRFVAGIAHPSAAAQAAGAAAALAILLRVGGTEATAGLTALPDGVFWNRTDAPD